MTAGLRPRPTLFTRQKRVGRKRRPNSLPFGYPALRRRFTGGQKLAALKHFPACFAKRPLRSGFVTGEGGASEFSSYALRLTISPPVSAAERRDFHPEKKDGCLSVASFRPSRIIIPERGNPPQAGQRGATFFWLLFLVVKKSNTPGRARPADSKISVKRFAGLRPRSTPYSFYAPKKSRQKKAPQLLALRVPCAAQTFCGRAKTRCAQTFPRLLRKTSTSLRRRHRG
jgi:hypothetical protein